MAGYVFGNGLSLDPSAELEKGRQQARESKIGRLLGVAYNDPAQRASALAQVAGLDAGRALQAQEAFQGADDARRKSDAANRLTLGQKAKAVVQAAESGNRALTAGLYRELVPEANQAFGGALSPEWDDAQLEGLKTFASIYAVGEQDDTPSAIRELQLLRDNPELAELDMKRRTAGFGRPQLFTDAQGNVSWLTPPQSGGGSVGAVDDGHPSQGVVMAAANRMAAAGVPSDEIDAWVQEQLSQPVTLGRATAPAAGVAPVPGVRGQTRAGQATYTPLNSDEVRALGLPAGTVAQRNVDSGQVDIISKPDARAGGGGALPVGALRELLDVQEALGGVQNVSAIIQKHAGRIGSGALQVSPVDAAGAKVRTFAGQANPNDVNLNEFNADKTRIVNESLRLNKGVQTEGDAQRAVQELMAANDQATAARALRRLAEINNRAVQLQRQKQALIRRNYGQDAAGNPLNAATPQAAPRPDAAPSNAIPQGWSIKVKP